MRIIKFSDLSENRWAAGFSEAEGKKKWATNGR
jgi:hypothetical protein